jgi:hypothetical protein
MMPDTQEPEGPHATLISEPVKVELVDGPEGIKQPGAFVWRGERFEVAELLNEWQEVGFGAGERTRTWYRRRHRNHYRVRTLDGAMYELYLDRGSGRRIWTLHKRLGEQAQ